MITVTIERRDGSRPPVVVRLLTPDPVDAMSDAIRQHFGTAAVFVRIGGRFHIGEHVGFIAQSAGPNLATVAAGMGRHDSIRVSVHRDDDSSGPRS